jgi:hypothetical protein
MTIKSQNDACDNTTLPKGKWYKKFLSSSTNTYPNSNEETPLA